MCLKFLVFVVLFCLRVHYISTASVSQSDTAGLLWDLSSYAVQSRQNPNLNLNAQYYKYHYPNELSTSYKPYPLYAKPYPYKPQAPIKYFTRPLHPLPNPNQFSNYPYNPYRPNTPQQESIMDILHSVASNDDLQCVPKIICEVTSGTMAGRQSPTGLPLNFNLESLVSLLSAWNGLQTSPLLHFGKAALLGYTSKGNTRSCAYSYPDCPSDPDRLVQYLNNHNGGFFRYFNGVHPANQQGYAPQYQQYNPYGNQNFHNLPTYNPYYRGRHEADRRIQTKPERYIPLHYFDNGYQNINFPVDEYNTDNYHNEIRPSKGLSFPTNHDEPSYYYPSATNSLRFPENEQNDVFRKPKQYFDNYSYYHHQNEVLDFQRPLPNHKATRNIFPDRTGTGELKLDAQEFGYRRDRPEDGNIVFKDRRFFSNRGYREYTDSNKYSNKGLVNFPS